ncbi:MAG: hypothetical protein IPO60_06080 [Flavobacteriales bacterium]|nr:hypothetical protein [Flavobacteriales bacterium]MBK9597889.1 hypothetical protein [Flavobacteriales bacterium]
MARLHLATMAGILLTCGYVAAFLFVIRRWRFFEAPGLPKRTICALFLLKVAVGTALWWIYTYHYPDRSTADIYRFFDDGNVLFSALPDHPGDYFRMLFGIGNDNAHFNEHYYAVMNNWHRKYDTGYYNDAHTMIRYSALVRLFSFGVYHVHTVFACFLSLVGLVALYKTFIGFVPEMNRALMAGLFLWPSMLFWGSAPIKEALLFLGLGLFLMGTFKLIVGPLSWKYIGLLVFGLLVQLVLKSYVLACMVPGLAALWWCRRTGGRHPILKFAATHTMAALLVLGLPIVAGGPDILMLITQKQRDMLGVVSLTDPGSYITATPLAPTLFSFLQQAPHALYMTFLSPFATGDLGGLGLLSALENMVMVVLLPVAALRARPWARIDLPLLLYFVSFCLFLGLLIGWTTPVVGALVRYRVPLLPFYTIALLLIADPRKLPSWAILSTR